MIIQQNYSNAIFVNCVSDINGEWPTSSIGRIYELHFLFFLFKYIVVDAKSFPEKPSVASVTQITLFTIGKLPRISLMWFICVKFDRKK